jgi:hypothetical protein
MIAGSSRGGTGSNGHDWMRAARGFGPAVPLHGKRGDALAGNDGARLTILIGYANTWLVSRWIGRRSPDERYDAENATLALVAPVPRS